MARNLFGDTAADVAEDVDGGRIPGAVGTVWDGSSDGATQVLDLTDESGAPIIQLVADQRGMISPFYGPDGVERLWVDFGDGKVGVLSTTVGVRLDAHQVGNDPHGDRAYVNDQLLGFVPIQGGSFPAPVGRDWVDVTIPNPADSTGNFLHMVDAAGNTYTAIKNSGSIYIDPVGTRAALAIGAPGYPSSQTVINVTNAKATPTTTASVFQVMGDGSVITKSSVSALGAVTGSNIGSARVFSGPNAPASPQAGDVWIQYG